MIFCFCFGRSIPPRKIIKSLLKRLEWLFAHDNNLLPDHILLAQAYNPQWPLYLPHAQASRFGYGWPEEFQKLVVGSTKNLKKRNLELKFPCQLSKLLRL